MTFVCVLHRKHQDLVPEDVILDPLQEAVKEKEKEEEEEVDLAQEAEDVEDVVV